MRADKNLRMNCIFEIWFADNFLIRPLSKSDAVTSGG